MRRKDVSKFIIPEVYGDALSYEEQVLQLQSGMKEVKETVNETVEKVETLEQEVDSKVTQSGESNVLYGTSDTGTQTTHAFSKNATANNIAQRDSNGQLKVPFAPSTDSDAVSSRYVDSAISANNSEVVIPQINSVRETAENALPKSGGTMTGNIGFGTGLSMNPPTNTSVFNGIEVVGNVRLNTGTLYMNGKKISNVATPTANDDVATKKYVDDSAAGGGGSSNNFIDITNDCTMSGGGGITPVVHKVLTDKRIIFADVEIDQYNGCALAYTGSDTTIATLFTSAKSWVIASGEVLTWFDRSQYNYTPYIPSGKTLGLDVYGGGEDFETNPCRVRLIIYTY